MAHTLTWINSNIILYVKVNNVTVSQPYTLQDGDVIEVYFSSTATIYSPIANLTSYSRGDTINLSDCDIYINATGSGGGAM